MTRALICISPEHVASARALAEGPPFGLSPESAAELFVPAGHLPGDETVALYWAAGLFTSEQAIALQQLAAARPWANYSEYDLKTQPDFPRQKLAELGLEPFTSQMP